jgi:hypothetical protein
MSDLRELAGRYSIPDDVQAKVELSETIHRQRVKTQRRFATLNVVPIKLREKVTSKELRLSRHCGLPQVRVILAKRFYARIYVNGRRRAQVSA